VSAQDELLEDVAQWLEQRAPYLEAAEAAGLAARIREGEWLKDRARRSAVTVLIAAAERKLARGGGLMALTEAELIAYSTQYVTPPEGNETP
jgi:hypothetical protein